MHSRGVPGAALPATAAALALGVLAAPFVPALFPLVLAGASAAACALVLVRRPARRLALALAAVALWLVVGLAGAWALRARALAGFAWVVTVLFLLPLPLLPWVYYRTFVKEDVPPTPQAHGEGGAP